jgi:hypothetical protein
MAVGEGDGGGGGGGGGARREEGKSGRGDGRWFLWNKKLLIFVAKRKTSGRNFYKT